MISQSYSLDMLKEVENLHLPKEPAHRAAYISFQHNQKNL